MGKKLDAFLGRGFKTSKFKATLNLAISRVLVLKNQHQARYSVTRSDVVQMLNLGQHERALHRVDLVIKEQNIIDVFAMVETYCHLLKERVDLLVPAKECPEELKEAISSMIYAASRCGQFPELQELRAVFASRFGKEFVARAVELRNNCGVSPKMIQKLSTRMPSLENRVKVLKEIALENNIVLQIEEAESVATEVKMAPEKEEEQPEAGPSDDSRDSRAGINKHTGPDMEMIEELTKSMKTRRKYKDVADAAQAAFESAACAAEAAKAAVELYRTDSHDSDDSSSSSLQRKKIADSPEHVESKTQTSEAKDSKGVEDLNAEVGLEKVHPIQDHNSESEYYKTPTESKLEKFEQNERDTGYKRSLSTSSLDSIDKFVNETIESSEGGKTRPPGTSAVFDDSDDETENTPNIRDSSNSETVHNVKDDVAEESKGYYPSEKQSLLESQAGLGSVRA